nr:pollen receptor-like kinase 4 [Tanacetum cinerariifolium]
MKRTLWLDKGTTEQELVTWVNSIGREEWTSKVFDNCMKWAKNNKIEMIDLMGIGLRCCESDVSRRWDMRKTFSSSVYVLSATPTPKWKLLEYDYKIPTTTYKVFLSEGSVVVAKRFLPKVIKEGVKVDFHAHMMLLGSMSHPNLLPYVACKYDEDRLLITDFAVNGRVASHLHVALKDGDQQRLDWPTRLIIIHGVAIGIDFLNQQCPGLSLPHGHLSSSNVLLDEAFNPLLEDYALAPILKSIPKVFDNCMKWAKNNEIKMIDLMDIGLRCCESDVSRRWDMRKVFEKIQGLRETKNKEEYLSDSSEE